MLLNVVSGDGSGETRRDNIRCASPTFLKLKACDVGEYADFGESVQLVERVFDD
ncbi:hypothetical protein [Thalassoglobus polymorphus]|uniref:Uncharacterized protein n=1 Tax=Thalassoglobus polymorphus TaxID=2527994 RepID=A0A517QLJ3_9PLAN|nr:hypothetical protein [Thalassoglobus polymorphus]QDT32496.1 hypothetical protein Mal48_17430 [Thalassoglobus polymorphus]